MLNWPSFWSSSLFMCFESDIFVCYLISDVHYEHDLIHLGSASGSPCIVSLIFYHTPKISHLIHHTGYPATTNATVNKKRD